MFVVIMPTWIFGILFPVTICCFVKKKKAMNTMQMLQCGSQQFTREKSCGTYFKIAEQNYRYVLIIERNAKYVRNNWKKSQQRNGLWLGLIPCIYKLYGDLKAISWAEKEILIIMGKTKA